MSSRVRPRWYSASEASASPPVAATASNATSAFWGWPARTRSLPRSSWRVGRSAAGASVRACSRARAADSFRLSFLAPSATTRSARRTMAGSGASATIRSASSIAMIAISGASPRSNRPARSSEITRLRERLGAEMADVVADRALLRRLAPELADERPRLALLVGRDRVRPRALDLGRDRRAGARRPGDGDGGRQEQRPEDDRAEHRHAARRPPCEEDPLERSQVRQDREDPEGGVEEGEERADGETYHTLRALHHPHGAPDAEIGRASCRERV